MMKKRNIFLMVLGGMFLLGVLFILIGIAFGGTIHTLSIQSDNQKIKKSVSHELNGVSVTDTQDIQGLDFTLNADNITIRNGTQFAVSGGTLSKNKVADGVWYIKSSVSDHFYYWNLFGFRLPIPKSRQINDTSGDIVITLPQDITLSDVTLQLNATDVDIQTIACDTINLDLSASSASIYSLLAKNAVFSVSAGEMDVERYQISEAATLSCAVGDISLGKAAYASQNLCSQLYAECSAGDLDINGKLIGDNKIACTAGDITLNLPGTGSNYSINHTSQSLGDISFHGEASDSSDTQQYGTLDLDCTLGDIDITYLGS